ncbi:tetratricopeptide repeat protein [Hymenobacter artigasi]|uniref:Tetratricopeptide (TPR) repeat protein n=1 Tax=Hymenobacter artigasi TaxID=2719616 RepID=A0ABX1HJV2_9BACT|nr:hypothetical protein [Hymenobacter artigasi]NKI89432.1 tetratricopeptide (TPR) repeat protein [Hymenobacter artigasi]
MKLKNLFIAAAMLFGLFGCKPSKKNEAFKAFNEGVAFSLTAIDLFEQKAYEQSDSLNKKAINKFQETLLIDSTHSGTRSALGHSYYLVRQFKESINWFEKANKIDGESAINFRELGLSRINLGRVPEGHQDLQMAFELDKSQEIRSITTDD